MTGRSVTGPGELRRALYEAQGGLCALCGEPMPLSRWDCAHATVWKKNGPTLDHIRPRSRGGSDAPENLQLAHARCNKAKGDRWPPSR